VVISGVILDIRLAHAANMMDASLEIAFGERAIGSIITSSLAIHILGRRHKGRHFFGRVNATRLDFPIFCDGDKQEALYFFTV
jgi:hypothetical protein